MGGGGRSVEGRAGDYIQDLNIWHASKYKVHNLHQKYILRCSWGGAGGGEAGKKQNTYALLVLSTFCTVLKPQKWTEYADSSFSTHPFLVPF